MESNHSHVANAQTIYVTIATILRMITTLTLITVKHVTWTVVRRRCVPGAITMSVHIAPICRHARSALGKLVRSVCTSVMAVRKISVLTVYRPKRGII